MMINRLNFLVSGSLMFLLFSRAALGQSLEIKDVDEAMNAPEAKGAYRQCFEGKSAPAELNLHIVIAENGSFNLSSTDPALDPDAYECVKDVTSAVWVHPSSQKYKLTYMLRLAEMPPPPAPPAPAARAGTGPGRILKSDLESMDAKYKKGRKILVGGSALLAVSLFGISVIAPLTGHYAKVIDSSSAYAAALAMLVYFPIAAVTGIILVAEGARNMREVLIERNLYFNGNVAIAPDPCLKGAVLSYSLNF
jgi:hypothetical protein